MDEHLSRWVAWNPPPAWGRKGLVCVLPGGQGTASLHQMDSNLCPCPFLAVQPWGSDLTSLSLNFSLCKLRRLLQVSGE